VSVSGTNVTIIGAPGSFFNGNWDGKGGGGGKKKPKFFQAHNLVNSIISGITIVNSPVHVFSISGAKGLTLDSITIDNRDGDSLGANTDGFDIGTSTGVTITKAVVYNQDDCVAVNSGTVSLSNIL
jgi:polygalacturonase